MALSTSIHPSIGCWLSWSAFYLNCCCCRRRNAPKAFSRTKFGRATSALSLSFPVLLQYQLRRRLYLITILWNWRTFVVDDDLENVAIASNTNHVCVCVLLVFFRLPHTKLFQGQWTVLTVGCFLSEFSIVKKTTYWLLPEDARVTFIGKGKAAANTLAVLFCIVGELRQ